VVDLKELPPTMRPAEREGDGARIIRDGVLFAGQPLEAAPAVDLQYAGVVGQHLAGPVLGIDVRRRQVALPGAVIPGER
jgi:MOSC domain-containing protein YiiM